MPTEDIREVKIKELNIQKLYDSFSMVVIGPPGSGKSSFIEDFCYKNKHKYPVMRTWSGTEDEQKNFRKFTKPLFITGNEYVQTEHDKGAMRQKLCIADSDCKNSSTIFVIDDCNTDKSVFSSKLMKAQFKNGTRWWNNAFILGSHYVFDMPPDLRKCVSYAVIFKETSIEERKKLYQNFAIGCDFKEFCTLMDELTGDHSCLVFDKRADSNNLEDCVYYYKADLHGKWEFGCDEYKNWHSKRYNENYVPTY